MLTLGQATLSAFEQPAVQQLTAKDHIVILGDSTTVGGSGRCPTAIRTSCRRRSGAVAKTKVVAVNSLSRVGGPLFFAGTRLYARAIAELVCIGK